MDMSFTEDEKKLFVEIQRLRDFNATTSVNPTAFESLFLKNIVINNMAIEGIEPTLGQLDALVDDIEHYIKKSFEDFLVFLKHEKDLK